MTEWLMCLCVRQIVDLLYTTTKATPEYQVMTVSMRPPLTYRFTSCFNRRAHERLSCRRVLTVCVVNFMHAGARGQDDQLA